jgi:hypothetical protein
MSSKKVVTQMRIAALEALLDRIVEKLADLYEELDK